MLKPILHNPTAAGVGSWLGIGTAASSFLSWLVKMNTEWFGVLSWPQSILIGIVATLAGALALAIATLVGGIGYRYFRPILKQSAEATTEPLPPQPYDDTKLKAEIAELTRVKNAVIDDYQAMLAKTDKLGALIEQSKKEVTDYVNDVKNMLFDKIENTDDVRRVQYEAIMSMMSGVKETLLDYGRFFEHIDYALRAIYDRELMPKLAALVNENAEKLCDRTGDGKVLDEQGWADWQLAYLSWRGDFFAWAKIGKYYHRGNIIDNIEHCSMEALSCKVAVRGDQFPDDEGLLAFKKFAISWDNWRRIEGEVMAAATQQAFEGKDTHTREVIRD